MKALRGVTNKEALEFVRKCYCQKVGNSYSNLAYERPKTLRGGILDWVIDILPVKIHMPQQDPKTGEIQKSNFIRPGTK